MTVSVEGRLDLVGSGAVDRRQAYPSALENAAAPFPSKLIGRHQTPKKKLKKTKRLATNENFPQTDQGFGRRSANSVSSQA